MESETHKRLKNKLAGKNGITEQKIKHTNKRLDAKNPTTNTVTEIEKSGNIEKAILRLKSQKNFKKQLIVPTNDLDKAKELATKLGVKMTIQNLPRTKRRFVK